MVELIKVILQTGFTIAGIAIGVTLLVSVLFMISNTKEGKVFSYFSFLPVLDKGALNDKGNAARRIYNVTLYCGWVWCVLFLLVRYEI